MNTQGTILLVLATVILFLYWCVRPDSKYDLMNQAELDAFLQQPLPKVVMVHANWCGYCQQVKPESIRVARRTGRLLLVDGDTPFGSTIMKSYKIESFPTFIRFDEKGMKSSMQVGVPEKGVSKLLDDTQ
jgi:thiol-disulfide isomerase/thioredoxin